MPKNFKYAALLVWLLAFTARATVTPPYTFHSGDVITSARINTLGTAISEIQALFASGLPIVDGGIGATTAAGGRTALSVPGLTSANTLTNTNSFTGVNGVNIGSTAAGNDYVTLKKTGFTFYQDAGTTTNTLTYSGSTLTFDGMLSATSLGGSGASLTGIRPIYRANIPMTSTTAVSSGTAATIYSVTFFAARKITAVTIVLGQAVNTTTSGTNTTTIAAYRNGVAISGGSFNITKSSVAGTEYGALFTVVSFGAGDTFAIKEYSTVSSGTPTGGTGSEIYAY